MGIARAGELWQSSWEKFVEAYNSCKQTVVCKNEEFVGKEVIWQRTVKTVEDKDRGIIVVLDPQEGPPFLDKTGAASSRIGFVLHPSDAEQGAWRRVGPGQMVRFRTRTVEGYGGVVGFTSLGGNNFALVNTEGAVLLEIIK